jgi:hypothetical protein
MIEQQYRHWLANQGKEPGTLDTSASTIRRIEEQYGDLETEYLLNGLEPIFSELAYSKNDERAGAPNPSKIKIDGNIYATLSSLRTHLNYYRRFLEDRAAKSPFSQVDRSSSPTTESVALEVGDDPIEAVLSLERDLNNAIREHIAQLEPGMNVVDGGKERSVPSGRIDILAKDETGRNVVIELKAGRAQRDAVGQLLAYMGDIQAEVGGEVRGILIAKDFDPKVVSAARVVPSLTLRRFSFQFKFEAV